MRGHTLFSFRYLYGVSFLLLGLVFAFSSSVFAGTYGANSYGSCDYNKCPDKPVSTQTVLPSGLEVSVNLTDGQAIPRSGYTITVTPLNGAGSSFRSVDFYIDGKLAEAGVLPADTGTASWKWDTKALPGTVVRVVVTDKDGKTTAQEFTVHIEDIPPQTAIPGTTSNNTPATAQPANVDAVGGGVVGVLHSIAEGAQHVIRALPRPVVYSFPYILFALLAVNAVVLLLQTKREISEYKTLKALLARMHAMDEGKKTFLELVSHYLRTPLTIISGGIDMAHTAGVVQSNAVDLTAIGKRLRDKIEGLITQVDAVVQAVQTPTALGPKLRVWRRPGLLLPLLLCGLTAFGFTELTKRAGTFNVSQVNQATQIIIFCLVASATYYLFRSIQLHKRDTALLQAVVDQETVAIKARDELIIHAAQALKDDLDGLGVGLASLGTARAVNFIRTGHGQLQELLRKFLLVAYLRGGRSSAPFSDVRLQDVLGEISRSLEPKAAAKRVTIVPDAANASLTVQEPTLLRFVLQSLMDNAVAYSAEGAAVHVGVSPESDRTLVTVTDSGASIPADKLQTIFQPFFKAEGAESFNHEGAGLSLYIDKLIMTYMGGLISVESAADKTAFTVSLPGPRSAAS